MFKRLALLVIGILAIVGASWMAAPWWGYLPGVILAVGTLISFNVYDPRGDAKRYKNLNRGAIPSLIGNDMDDGAA